MAPPTADRPLIVFAHGAGAPSSSPWMRRWAQRLGALGTVVAFDYPYMRQKRRAPDKLPVLVAAHREALAQARAQAGAGAPVVLAGKSMGSRVGCHLAVELAETVQQAGTPPAALICFGYPLRAVGSGTLRDEVLRQLSTPILFLQGSRDALCPLADLETVRGVMRAPNELFVVEGGDHSLTLGRKRPAPGERSQDDWDTQVFEAARRFLTGRGLAVGSGNV
jgi:predicted alpha/beta-hydrolase family hydrolase